MGLNFWQKVLTLFKAQDQLKGQPMNQTTEKKEAMPEQKETPRKVTEEDVCKQVMEKLGKPPKFHRCVARKITGTDKYRVNVWDKGIMSSGHITDSFFVKMNDEGKIVSPEIKRKYPSIHKV